MTGFYSVYIESVISSRSPSPLEEVDLNCSRKDGGQIVRRTSWFCELIKGRSYQLPTHSAAGSVFCSPTPVFSQSSREALLMREACLLSLEICSQQILMSPKLIVFCSSLNSPGCVILDQAKPAETMEAALAVFS